MIWYNDASGESDIFVTASVDTSVTGPGLGFVIMKAGPSGSAPSDRSTSDVTHTCLFCFEEGINECEKRYNYPLLYYFERTYLVDANEK